MRFTIQNKLPIPVIGITLKNSLTLKQTAKALDWSESTLAGLHRLISEIRTCHEASGRDTLPVLSIRRGKVHMQYPV